MGLPWSSSLRRRASIDLMAAWQWPGMSISGITWDWKRTMSWCTKFYMALLVRAAAAWFNGMDLMTVWQWPINAITFISGIPEQQKLMLHGYFELISLKAIAIKCCWWQCQTLSEILDRFIQYCNNIIIKVPVYDAGEHIWVCSGSHPRSSSLNPDHW